MINGLDMPVRQALVVAFVPKRAYLTNAIGVEPHRSSISRG